MGCSSSASGSTPGSKSTKPKGQMNMGYYNFRGIFRGQVPRYLIAYSGAPCQEVNFTIGTDEWKEKKTSGYMPFPNLPYIEHGPFKLSEWIAVC